MDNYEELLKECVSLLMMTQDRWAEIYRLYGKDVMNEEATESYRLLHDDPEWKKIEEFLMKDELKELVKDELQKLGVK